MARSHGGPAAEAFAELKGPMSREEARIESSRCLYCYDAPCVAACPTHIDVPRFIRQIASADPLGSGETILEANALGHSCARVCPVEVLCEGACVYHDWHEKPIEIARLQRHATDAVYAAGEPPFRAGEDNGKRVAIIGAGPAGASCAAYLRRLGFAVTIFEKRRLPGGLNTYGVAEYKMSQPTALEEMRFLFKLGCDLVTGKEVGKDVPAADVLRRFDALFIGIGLSDTRSLGIPGEELPGVMDALSFIERVKAKGGRGVPPSADTVVIGGGNTAIDAATQSLRAGAGSVVLAYRRGAEDLSAYDFEIVHAKKDGVRILTHAAPVRILGKKKAEGVQFKNARGAKFALPADRVIKAIGQTKHIALAKAFGLALREDGRLKVDADTLATSKPSIFAGGDAVNGGKEVVNAAADGKRAAWGIQRALFPDRPAPAENQYWISTITGRKVAPIMPRSHS
ncbi:MAG: NAD(P)-dependent oxidoreductase [Elusimicrobia bacterium]|nr:NAD(P)-dependent oxidoreductase [Elusimicrobiota bacterium]